MGGESFGNKPHAPHKVTRPPQAKFVLMSFLIDAVYVEHIDTVGWVMGMTFGLSKTKLDVGFLVATV